MPTVIDSLIVTLGLDAKPFKQGQRDTEVALHKTETQATRTATTLEARGKQGAEFFGVMKRAAGMLGIALTAVGIKNFALKTMDSSAALGRLAHNLDMSTGALSAWGLAAQKMAGAGADAASNSIAGLSQSLEQLQDFGDMSPSLAIMQRLGIPVIRNGKAVDWNELLLSLADKFHAMDPRQATLLGQRMGLDPGLVNFLEQGRATVAAAVASEKGNAITDADAKAMQDLQTAALDLQQRFEAFGRHLVFDVEPQLLKFFHGLGDVIDVLQGKLSWKDFYGKIYKAINPNSTIKPGESVGVAQKRDAEAVTEGRKQAVSYFMSQGWSRDDAAAITAQVEAESSFNPKAKNGDHIGLAQWDAPRRAAILAGTGIDVATAGAADQLRAIQWELTHTEKAAGDALRNAKGPRQKAYVLDDKYERSGDGWARRYYRGNIAVQIASNATAAPARAETSPRAAPAQAAAQAPAVARWQGVEGLVQSLRAKTAANNTRIETHINGPITVNTRATDAPGIAKAIGGAIRQNGLVPQANTGLS